MLKQVLFIICMVAIATTATTSAEQPRVCNATAPTVCITTTADKIKDGAVLTIPCSEAAKKANPSCQGERVQLSCATTNGVQHCTWKKQDETPARTHKEICQQFRNSPLGKYSCANGTIHFRCKATDPDTVFDYSIVHSPEGAAAVAVVGDHDAEIKKNEAFVAHKTEVKPDGANQISDEKVLDKITCTNDGHARLRLVKGTTVMMQTEKCKISELKKDGVIFLKTGTQWQAHCGKEIVKQQGFDPNTAHKAKDADEFHKNLHAKPGESQRLDTEHGTIVAQCDAQGKCAMQVFKKDASGNLIPGRYIDTGVTPEALKVATDSLKGPDGKAAFDALFNAKGCTGTTCAPQACTGPSCSATNPPPSNTGNNHQNDASNGRFKPTSSGSGQQQKPQQSAGSGQQPQQQTPQQQNPFANSPAPYCANVTVNKREVTQGESAVIQWSIPYAIRFEIRGGNATIQGSSAVVRPTETTSYSVIGYGIPGAGQQSNQYSPNTFGYSTTSGLGDSSLYGGQATQFGAPQQAQNCGIPGAACCKPVTIVVNQKQPTTPNDTTVEDVQDEADADFATTKPDVKCSPKEVEYGKNSVVIWDCPDGSERSTTVAQHSDGTVLTSKESFYGEGKIAGTKKVFPASDTNYTVRCISSKGKRSLPASCSVRVVEKTQKQASTNQNKTAQNLGGMTLSITTNVTKIRAKIEEVTVTWKSTGADTCQVIGPDGYKQDNTKTGTVSGTSDNPGIITFALTCKANGVQKTQKTSVQVTE